MEAPAKLVFFAALAVFAVGCGKGNSDSGLTVEKRQLDEVHACYMHYLKANGTAPTKLADFEEWEKLYALGMRALREEKYIVVWGVAKRDAGTILAYEPRAAAEGGVVLMADGAVKTMTAAQFKNAKPAP